MTDYEVQKLFRSFSEFRATSKLSVSRYSSTCFQWSLYCDIGISCFTLTGDHPAECVSSLIVNLTRIPNDLRIFYPGHGRLLAEATTMLFLIEKERIHE